jgi:hypothetical protein
MPFLLVMQRVTPLEEIINIEGLVAISTVIEIEMRH